MKIARVPVKTNKFSMQHSRFRSFNLNGGCGNDIVSREGDESSRGSGTMGCIEDIEDGAGRGRGQNVSVVAFIGKIGFI